MSSSSASSEVAAGAAGGVGRRPRADARRNAAAVVAAARVVFAERGVDAPVKEVVDRAGVGTGTLYRHFPRRSDLVVAVLHDDVAECVAAAQEVAATLGPEDALATWVDRYTRFVATKQGLAAALHSGDPAYDGLADMLLAELEPSLTAVLERAREVGRVSGALSARDVLVAVALLCQPVAGQPADFPARAVRTFVRGLSGGDSNA